MKTFEVSKTLTRATGTNGFFAPETGAIFVCDDQRGPYVELAIAPKQGRAIPTVLIRAASKQYMRLFLKAALRALAQAEPNIPTIFEAKP